MKIKIALLCAAALVATYGEAKRNGEPKQPNGPEKLQQLKEKEQALKERLIEKYKTN